MSGKKIQFVKALYDVEKGFTYCYFIKFDDCTCREYINLDDAGKTVVQEVKQECLPKYIQAFMSKHEKRLFSTYDTVEHYVWK